MLPSTPPVIRNAWYAAALTTEVGRTPLRRVILGTPIVLWRTEAGTPVALLDRCCHRHAPLSPGKLIGDTIECPYHGLRFDAGGACTFVPGQERIPRRASVAAYPIIERYGFLWLWPGTPEAADPGRLPHWPWAEATDWSSRVGYFPIGCNYMLSVDNLMDLSHIGYVHASTIGSAADGEDATVETLSGPGHVTVRRWLQNRPPSPGLARRFGTDPVDRWQVIEFRPPCYIRTFKGLGAGVYGTPGYTFDSAEANPPDGALSVSRGCTCITPATEDSCHYFTVHCHHRPESEAQVDAAWGLAVEALEQDVEILEQT
ncbi:MAG: aromatic ring-hydroxylating dioxygenase subunit alpha, partial [Pseudomonadota bacterium]